MEQLKLKDFLNYRFLSAVRYAPDGKRAVFVVSNSNEEENCYESRLWMYDGQLRQLTGIGKEGQFFWEDETHILFPAVRSAAEEKRQKAGEQFTSFYRLDVTGGEAVPAFTLPFAAQDLRSLGNGKWLVMGKIDAGCSEYYGMTAEERTEADEARKKEKDYEVFDEIPFWGNGRGVTNKLRRALFVYDTADGSCKRVTDSLFQTDSFEVIGDTEVDKCRWGATEPSCILYTCYPQGIQTPTRYRYLAYADPVETDENGVVPSSLPGMEETGEEAAAEATPAPEEPAA